MPYSDALAKILILKSPPDFKYISGTSFGRNPEDLNLAG